MANYLRNKKCLNLKLFYFITITSLAFFNFSCSKQKVFEQSIHATNSLESQSNYVAKIKNSLKDSLNADDFSALQFSKVYKSKDVQSQYYFLRIGFVSKNIATDFILMQTDNAGNIFSGKIIHVSKSGKQKNGFVNYLFTVSALNRNTVEYISNSNSGATLKEAPAGEQTLPDVVVTGYVYDDPAPYYWYSYDDLLGMSSGGGTYTYGASEPHGGGAGVSSDETINISYEYGEQSPIDIAKYIKCFSLLSNQGATFKITIYSDIPVNSDPYELFDFSTGACGHTFLQLTKSSGGSTIQQNIGFYPLSGWKSIANSPVTSKLVDNAGHEYNASLTITVDATHFQNALNKIQSQSTRQYDIDDYNCTDFALSVFNSAASTYLSITRMHIPNGTVGTTSNTPQGLYVKLSSLQKTGGYPGGQISLPNTAPKAAGSHGACN